MSESASAESDGHELDLPLSANIRDVDISHFLLHVTCDLEQKSLSGDITLFCRPAEGGAYCRQNECKTEVFDSLVLHSRDLGQSALTTNCNEDSESGSANVIRVPDKTTDQSASSSPGQELVCYSGNKKQFDSSSVTSNGELITNEVSISSEISAQSFCLSNNCESLNLSDKSQKQFSCTVNEIKDINESKHLLYSRSSRDVEHPVIILDAHSLDVSCVEELMLLPEMKMKLLSATRADIESETGVYMQCYSQTRTRPLAYSVSEHSLRIWRNLEDKAQENDFKGLHYRRNETERNYTIESEKTAKEAKSVVEIDDGEDSFNKSAESVERTEKLQCDQDVVIGKTNPLLQDRLITVGEMKTNMIENNDEIRANVEESDCVTDLTESTGGKSAGLEGETDGEMTSDGEIPQVVRIHYRTRPGGPSLKWTLDQDGRPCMFTIGHWLNNRSWFPSQDAPSAMPTWQAVVTVLDHLTVLMSGDQTCHPTASSRGCRTFYYYTTMPMPTSTLAIAAGSWRQVDVTPEVNEDPDSSMSPCVIHGSTCIVNYASRPDLPCRVFAAEHLVSVVEKELAVYIPKCLREVHSILGDHPFQRLDVLIVPQCFDSLGMASPSLLLLSQSLLVGDYSMCARVAHEICHSWFGLLIGPRDWTEEWLTEGFCTYLEDILHARVCQWNDMDTTNHLELRALLKQKTLVSEVQNTQEDLQRLRPNQGEQLQQDSSVQYVKNGMNPDKGFMQVHYLKGFFLLRHLEKQVGLTQFLHFLHQYVVHYHAQLVTSQDFFDFFFKTFPHLREEGMSETELITEWLDCSELTQDVKQFTPRSSNHLWKEVKLHVTQIQSFCARMISTKMKKKRKLDMSGITLGKLDTDQLVVLLEDLLLLDHIPGSVLDLLHHTYQLSAANPEIRHRWCELVIKQHHKTGYSDLRSFLLNDQAMGVYMYGEMMLSGCKKQKQLALQCFDIVGSDMPHGAHKIVHSMLYGT